MKRKISTSTTQFIEVLPDKEDDILFHLNKRAESIKNSRKEEKEEEKR